MWVNNIIKNKFKLYRIKITLYYNEKETLILIHDCA